MGSTFGQLKGSVVPSPPKNDLRGSRPRICMGTLITLCGFIQFTFGMMMSDRPFGFSGNAAFGMTNGILAMLTGSFGTCSRTKKSMVITFLVMTIISTFLGFSFGIVQLSLVAADEDIFFYDSSNSYPSYSSFGVERGRNVQYWFFVILCLAVSLETLFCIIGASFSCVAVCTKDDESDRSVPTVIFQPYGMMPTVGYSTKGENLSGVINLAAQLPPANTVNTAGTYPSAQFVTDQQTMTQTKGEADC